MTGLPALSKSSLCLAAGAHAIGVLTGIYSEQDLLATGVSMHPNFQLLPTLLCMAVHVLLFDGFMQLQASWFTKCKA